MTWAIQAVNLVRSYRSSRGELTALDGIDLTVERGELFGLLGPNGAGKTTFMKIAATLLLPTGGRMLVNGLNVTEHEADTRRSLGVLLANRRALYWKLTVKENLRFIGSLQGLTPAVIRKRSDQLLTDVGLWERRYDLVERLSTGMLQRAAIAAALIHDPPILILDEPTGGLDPVAALAIRDLIRSIHAQGRTVVLSTHMMDEADRLCGRVAIINAGRLVALGTPRDLKQTAGEQVIELQVEGNHSPQVLQDSCPPEVVLMFSQPGVEVWRGAVRVPAGIPDPLPALRSALDRAGCRLIAATVRKPSLEDVFIERTGHGYRAGGTR